MARFKLMAWKVDNYAADRRAHRHRCKCCRRIIVAGEAAFMARISASKTIAVHDACGDTLVVPGRPVTYRDALREAAFQHGLRCFGYSESIPAHWKRIEQFRSEAGVERQF